MGSAVSAAVHRSRGWGRTAPGTDSDSTAHTAESQTASESKPGAGAGKPRTASASAATASEGKRMAPCGPDACASMAMASAVAWEASVDPPAGAPPSGPMSDASDSRDAASWSARAAFAAATQVAAAE